MSATGLALLLAFAPPPACVREATELLARGEAEAAAVRGEACFADEGHAQGLLLASQAWLQAGRLAYARVDADRFLALKTGAKPARPLAGLAERTAGGAALLGAGAGALVGGLSGLVGAESARHKLWTAEAIAGGVLTGGGVALLAYGSAYFSTANTREPWPQADVGRGGQLYVLGAGLLGGGLGLAATAATGLIVELVQRRTGRRSARVSGGALRF